MKHILRTLLAAAAVAALVPTAQAATITINGEWSSADPVVSPRPTRDGTPSSCASSDAFPGTIAGNYAVDTFTLYNNSGTADCITVTHLSNSVNAALFVQAYGGANINVSDLGAISGLYLGDGGSSGLPISFSFLAPAYSAFTLAAFSADGLGTYGFSVEGMNIAYTPAKRSDVPEPATFALLAMAGAAGLLSRRRQRN